LRQPRNAGEQMLQKAMAAELLLDPHFRATFYEQAV
jgi:hypothetical protein